MGQPACSEAAAACRSPPPRPGSRSHLGRLQAHAAGAPGDDHLALGRAEAAGQGGHVAGLGLQSRGLAGLAAAGQYTPKTSRLLTLVLAMSSPAGSG